MLRAFVENCFKSLPSPSEDFQNQLQGIFCAFDKLTKESGKDAKQLEKVVLELRGIIAIVRFFPVEYKLALTKFSFHRTLCGLLSIYLDFKLVEILKINDNEDRKKQLQFNLNEVFNVLPPEDIQYIWSVIITSNILKIPDLLEEFIIYSLNRISKVRQTFDQYIRMIWVLFAYFVKTSSHSNTSRCGEILEKALQIKPSEKLDQHMAHNFTIAYLCDWKSKTPEEIHSYLLTSSRGTQKNMLKFIHNKILVVESLMSEPDGDTLIDQEINDLTDNEEDFYFDAHTSLSPIRSSKPSTSSPEMKSHAAVEEESKIDSKKKDSKDCGGKSESEENDIYATLLKDLSETDVSTENDSDGGNKTHDVTSKDKTSKYNDDDKNADRASQDSRNTEMNEETDVEDDNESKNSIDEEITDDKVVKKPSSPVKKPLSPVKKPISPVKKLFSPVEKPLSPNEKSSQQMNKLKETTSKTPATPVPVARRTSPRKISPSEVPLSSTRSARQSARSRRQKEIEIAASDDEDDGEEIIERPKRKTRAKRLTFVDSDDEDECEKNGETNEKNKNGRQVLNKVKDSDEDNSDDNNNNNEDDIINSENGSASTDIMIDQEEIEKDIVLSDGRNCMVYVILDDILLDSKICKEYGFEQKIPSPKRVAQSDSIAKRPKRRRR